MTTRDREQERAKRPTQAQLNNIFDHLIDARGKPVQVRYDKYGFHCVIRLTEITAQRFLARNQDNFRPLSPATVMYYSKSVSGNQFTLNGTSMQVDWWGNLLNGQHRCHARVEGGRDFEVLLYIGDIDDRCIDDLRARNYSDHLSRRPGNARPNYRTHANALRIINGYLMCLELSYGPMTAWERRGPRLNPYEMDALDVAYGDDLVGSIKLTQGLRSTKLLPQGNAAVLHLVMSTINAEKANEFFEMLCSGEGIPKGGNIVGELRQMLQAEAVKKSGESIYSQSVRAGWVVNAWNVFAGYCRKGRTGFWYRYVGSGITQEEKEKKVKVNVNEPFPEIQGLDAATFVGRLKAVKEGHDA